MRHAIRLSLPLIVLSIALPAGAQTAPAVEVSFEKPEAYVDAYPRARSGSNAELKQTLDRIQRIFAEQGARFLKPGDRLKVTVLDLDLAGEIEPGRTGILELRVLRSITWPRMTVRYTFTRDGKEKSAEAQVSDPGYQDNSGVCSRSGDFCYERQMIGRWLSRQFG